MRPFASKTIMSFSDCMCSSFIEVTLNASVAQGFPTVKTGPVPHGSVLVCRGKPKSPL